MFRRMGIYCQRKEVTKNTTEDLQISSDDSGESDEE